jgi:predicted transposase YdaD
LPEPVRITLSEVLEYWFFERFRNLTPREIYAMLSRLTPLEETRAYQDIFAEGEAEGEAKGKADSLTILLGQRFGPLPEWARERIATASAEQVDVWLRGLLAAPDLEGLIGTAPSSGH